MSLTLVGSEDSNSTPQKKITSLKLITFYWGGQHTHTIDSSLRVVSPLDGEILKCRDCLL